MQKTRYAATFALLLLLASSPSFAASSREETRSSRELSPFERIVQVIKHLIAKPLDLVTVPRP